jgi:hypothetical protein
MILWLIIGASQIMIFHAINPPDSEKNIEALTVAIFHQWIVMLYFVGKFSFSEVRFLGTLTSNVWKGV